MTSLPAYYWVLIVSWLVFVGYWLVSAVGAKRNAKPNVSFWWFRILYVVIFIIIVKFVPPMQYTPAPWVGWLGAILSFVGIAFAVWARYHLGKNWGMPMSVKDHPELVTTGPYRYVRHPIYTGVILSAIGTALVVGDWWICILALMCIYFIFSALQEEKLMAAEFPNQYPEYKKRSKMLIPFIF